jgi:hypothetical protein
VNLEELEARRRFRRAGKAAQGSPPDADRALWQRSGKIGDGHRNLLGPEPFETLGEPLDLPQAG